MRNPFLKFWRAHLLKHVSKGPKDLKEAIMDCPGLMMFILGRFVAVSCLRNEPQAVDPTDGRALGVIF